MKKSLLALLVALPFCNSHASEYIVDTGIVSERGQYSDRNFFFNSWMQYFGMKFETKKTYSINSIESSIVPMTGGNVKISIVSDEGNKPGGTLFSKDVQFLSAPLDENNNSIYPTAFSWAGVRDIDFRLNAGTYWATFVPEGKFDGFLPGIAVNPLPNMDYMQGGLYDHHGGDVPWTFQAGGGYWMDPKIHPVVDSYIPLRIGVSEAISPVPEAAEWELMSAGLLLTLFLVRRNRRQK